jgi:pimeloyl-ACP methyl ester carboxylesterase
MDATATDTAVIVGFSMGAQRGLILAAEHPDRIDRAVFIAANFPGGGNVLPERAAFDDFDAEYESYEGWAKFNRHHWLADYRDFVEFFVSKIFTEPHSTKPIEDGVAWGLETDGETLVATVEATRLAPEEAQALCSRVRCPVLVIHGERDAVTSFTRGKAIAEQTGGDFVLLEGAGTRRTSAIRSKSTCCCATSLRLPVRLAPGYAGSPAASARFTSPRRSGSATPNATPQSPTSCASCMEISRSTGSPSIR